MLLTSSSNSRGRLGPIVAIVSLGLLTYGCAAGAAYRPSASVASDVAAHGTMQPATAGPAPNVYGTRLHVPPGESAAARALVLDEQAAASKAANEQLAARLQTLRAELDAKNEELDRATSEVVEARSELAKARSELERWKMDLVAMRDKLQAADKENLDTLQATVTLLRQLMARDELTGTP